MSRQPEAKLVKDPCRKLAKANGLLFVNVESKGVNGWPDTACGKYPPGSGMIHIEFKRPGVEIDMTDTLNQQVRRINDIRAAGGEADWCNSVEGYKNLVGLP